MKRSQLSVIPCAGPEWLHLVDHGTSRISLNAAITGLKFSFEITLHEPDLMARIQPVQVPRTIPVVLSPDEEGRLIAA
ncbi:hypothetical protein P3T21_007737 [Paraburkholderia sp. GAS334]